MEPEKIQQKSEAEKSQELARLKSWVGKILKDDADRFDLKAEYDPTLTMAENKTQMREKLKLLVNDPESELKEKAAQAKADQEKLDNERIQAAEREAEEYNKNLQFADNKDLDTYYAPIIEGVKKMINGNSNLLMIQGPGAIGKCVVAGTEVLNQHGELVKIEDRPSDVLSMNQQFKLVPSTVTSYFEREVDEVITLKLRTGREITLTKNHPLYRHDGWTEAGKIRVGDMLATPRRYSIDNKDKLKDCEVRLLAYLIADGGLTYGSPLFTKKNVDVLNDFKIALSEFNPQLTMHPHGKYGYAIVDKEKVGKRSSIIDFVRQHRLYGKKSVDKEIPNNIFQTSDRQLTIFLGCLFDCDGSIEKDCISYSSGSKRMITQLVHLLLRIGVVGTTRNKVVGGTEYYEMTICSADMIYNFAKNVKLIAKEEKLRQLVERKRSKKRSPNIDLTPVEFLTDIRGEKYYKNRGVYFSKNCNPGRDKLKELYSITPTERLKLAIESDIFWDEVKKITCKPGKTKVYDIEVAKYHNFVANDIIIHNSHNIKKTLVQNNADYKEITGEITEAFLYRLIYENNGRILYLKDTVKLLQNISNLTLLKAATDTSEPRILTRSSYSKQQEDLPKEFVCKCKFIFDYNNVAGISLRQDFEALKTRGDYRQIFFSNHDMKNILKLVAKTPEEIEVTDFIIKEFDDGMKVKLNLRTQYKSMQTYNYCKEKGIDWKEMLHRELESTSKVRALLHTLIGEEAVRTSQLKKLLLQNEIVTSIASSHRKVTEWLFTDEIFRWSPEDANYLVCINPQPADYKWDKR